MSNYLDQDDLSYYDGKLKTYISNGLSTKINTSAKGTANGVAELDSSGLVPSSQLPSYVDDVLEYNTKSSFPATGETGKIYVDTSTNLTYRWSGSAYVEISPSIALGETSSTAYRGDRGKTAYDHSQITSGNPHNVTKSDVGLDNVNNTSDADKPVSTAMQTALNAKQDTLTFDDVPTANSNNPVKSGGVYSAIQSIDLSALGFSVVNGKLCQTYTI